MVSAKEYTLPSGLKIDVKEPEIKWVWKEWILPSGFKYLDLIPIAKAQSLTLRDEIILWIKSYAAIYKIPETGMIKLAECESGMNPEAFNPKDPKGGAYGLFQFLKPTFEAFKKEAKMPDLDYKDWRHQIQLTAWAFANNKYPQHWLNCGSFIKYQTWNKEKWK